MKIIVRRKCHWIVALLASAVFCWSGHAEASVVVTGGSLVTQAPADGASFAGGHIRADSSGNVILTSLDSSAVTKFNAAGVTLWNTPTGFTQSGQLLVDSSSNVYVNGSAGSSTASILAVEKINSAGHVVWSQRYNVGPVSEHMSGGPMALAANGSLYVLARNGNSSELNAATTLLRIDASDTNHGTELNRRSLGNRTDLTQEMTESALAVDASSNVFYGDPGGMLGFPPDLKQQTWRWSNQWPVRALVADRGNVYATGTETDNRGGWYMYVARVKATTGVNLGNPHVFSVQEKGVSYVQSGDDEVAYGGNAITVDRTGNIYVAGSANDGTYTGGIIAKFNAQNGALVWHQILGEDVSATCASVAVDSHSNAYVGCTDNRFKIGSSTALGVIYNTTGTQILFLDADGPGGQDDIFDGVAVGQLGNFFFLDESTYLPDPNSGIVSIVPAIFLYQATGL